MKKDTKQKILGVIGLGLGFTAGVMGGFLMDNPDTITKEVPVITEVLVPQECGACVCDIPEPVVCEKPETIIEIKEVEDTEMLKLLCDREMYDDIMDCKVEVKAQDEAIALAIKEIENEFADELEDAGIVEDEDDVEIVRIYDDFEDINVKDSDYDDEEYRFEIKVKVDDDESDSKKYVLFDVEVQDGEASIRNVEELI